MAAVVMVAAVVVDQGAMIKGARAEEVAVGKQPHCGFTTYNFATRS